MARAIDEACRENGWSVILCNTNDNYDRDREYIDLLADKGADGIVFIMAKDNTREMAAEEIDYLESIHIPYVVVDRIPELRNCPAVGTDHEIGGYLAARHLLSLGHRRIACVVGPHATQMLSLIHISRPGASETWRRRGIWILSGSPSFSTKMFFLERAVRHFRTRG